MKNKRMVWVAVVSTEGAALIIIATQKKSKLVLRVERLSCQCTTGHLCLKGT